ncbi:hypothetical protein WDW89_24840 [Deltaproteobacteria bacterium TL4]
MADDDFGDLDFDLDEDFMSEDESSSVDGFGDDFVSGDDPDDAAESPTEHLKDEDLNLDGDLEGLDDFDDFTGDDNDSGMMDSPSETNDEFIEDSSMEDSQEVDFGQDDGDMFADSNFAADLGGDSSFDEEEADEDNFEAEDPFEDQDFGDSASSMDDSEEEPENDGLDLGEPIQELSFDDDPHAPTGSEFIDEFENAFDEALEGANNEGLEEQSPKRRWKEIVLLIGILSVISGGVYFGGAPWFVEKKKTAVLSKSEQQPLNKISVLRLPDKTPVPEKKQPPAPKTEFYLSIATCNYKTCVEDYVQLLRKYGYRPLTTKVSDTVSMSEILSQEVYSAYKAEQWAQRINREHPLSGYAYRKKTGQRYRISLGVFPDKSRAIHVQTELNYRFAGQLRFVIREDSHVIPQTQIRLGTYFSPKQAKQIQADLAKKNHRFQNTQILEISPHKT